MVGTLDRGRARKEAGIAISVARTTAGRMGGSLTHPGRSGFSRISPRRPTLGHDPQLAIGTAS